MFVSNSNISRLIPATMHVWVRLSGRQNITLIQCWFDIRVAIHKMLVRKATRKDPDQTVVCLGLFYMQLVYEILEYLQYTNCKLKGIVLLLCNR